MLCRPRIASESPPLLNVLLLNTKAAAELLAGDGRIDLAPLRCVVTVVLVSLYSPCALESSPPPARLCSAHAVTSDSLFDLHSGRKSWVLFLGKLYKCTWKQSTEWETGVCTCLLLLMAGSSPEFETRAATHAFKFVRQARRLKGIDLVATFRLYIYQNFN